MITCDEEIIRKKANHVAVKQSYEKQLKTTRSDIDPAVVRKAKQNQWIIDCRLLLRKVTILNVKDSKTYHECLFFVLLLVLIDF